MSKFIVNGVELTMEDIQEAAKRKKRKTGDKSDKIEECKEVFPGKKLKVCGLRADLDIQPTEGEQIVVMATGPKCLLDQLEIKQKGDWVYIGEKETSKNVVNIVNDGQNITFHGGVCVSNVVASDGGSISFDTGGRKLGVQILVPKRSRVRISSLAGVAKANIGKLDGNLSLKMAGSSSAQVASVHHLEVDAAGCSKVAVEKVNGSVELDLAGSAKVNIRGGNINKLAVDTSGASVVNVEATANKANLNASGSSRIRVRKVTGSICRDRSGTSSITVG